MARPNLHLVLILMILSLERVSGGLWRRIIQKAPEVITTALVVTAVDNTIDGAMKPTSKPSPDQDKLLLNLIERTGHSGQTDSALLTNVICLVGVLVTLGFTALIMYCLRHLRNKGKSHQVRYTRNESQEPVTLNMV